MNEIQRLEKLEAVFAQMLADKAAEMAECYDGLTQDLEAAKTAILVRAVELSTPDLPPRLRAALFLENDQ